MSETPAHTAEKDPPTLGVQHYPLGPAGCLCGNPDCPEWPAARVTSPGESQGETCEECETTGRNCPLHESAFPPGQGGAD